MRESWQKEYRFIRVISLGRYIDENVMKDYDDFVQVVEQDADNVNEISRRLKDEVNRFKQV